MRGAKGVVEWGQQERDTRDWILQQSGAAISNRAGRRAGNKRHRGRRGGGGGTARI
jgi:hypothetical protein